MCIRDSLSLVLLLGDSEEVSKTLLDKVNILAVVFDTAGDNEALLWGNVVHHKLLHDSGVDVANVGLESKRWHTESSVAISCSEEELLVVGEWIVLAQVGVQVVRLLVLGLGDVGSEN